MRDLWSPRSYCDATGFELVRSGQMFAYFAKKICHHFRPTSVHSDFFPHQILSSLIKLQIFVRSVNYTYFTT